jgi:hypothetical protein
MPRLNARVLGCIGSALVLLVASPRVAGASLIFDTAIILTGQGFGAAPPDFTSQDNANPESGCVA